VAKTLPGAQDQLAVTRDVVATYFRAAKTLKNGPLNKSSISPSRARSAGSLVTLPGAQDRLAVTRDVVRPPSATQRRSRTSR
jgi:hypothetical protein